jgi:hypothetical protein
MKCQSVFHKTTSIEIRCSNKLQKQPAQIHYQSRGSLCHLDKIWVRFIDVVAFEMFLLVHPTPGSGP